MSQIRVPRPLYREALSSVSSFYIVSLGRPLTKKNSQGPPMATMPLKADRRNQMVTLSRDDPGRYLGAVRMGWKELQEPRRQKPYKQCLADKPCEYQQEAGMCHHTGGAGE